MSYLGDYAEDSVIDFKFTTRNSTGTPVTFSGSPTLAVYKDNDAAETATGLTLTVDFDSRTGCNHVRIDTSSDAFYVNAEDYQVVVTAGTVNSVSVVGEVVATFSIGNRTATSAASILAAGDIDGYSLEETLKLCLAALAGKLTVSGGTVTIRAADDSKARITATVDSNGNRTSITLDETG